MQSRECLEAACTSSPSLVPETREAETRHSDDAVDFSRHYALTLSPPTFRPHRSPSSSFNLPIGLMPYD